MRKLNLQWLTGLVLGSIGLVVFGFALHEFQMWRNAPSFIREAKRAQAEDRPEDAATYLSRYVKLAPKDSEGLILYGFQLADLGNVSGAFLTLEKALRMRPERSDVRRRLVKLSIQLRRFADAMDHLQNHLLKDSPTDAELLEQLSLCYFARGEFEKADAELVSAIKSAPHGLQAYVELASLRQEKLQQSSEAIETINQMVSDNADSYLAYLYRGQWLMQHLKQLAADLKVGRLTGSQSDDDFRVIAETDAEKTVELAPDDADAIAFAATMAHGAGHSVKARELALHGIDVHPSDSRFYTLLAQLESTAGNQTATIDLIKKSTVADPKNLGLKWNLANLLIDGGNYDEAMEEIAKLRAAKHPEVRINYLEAKIKIRRNEWLPAIQQLEAIRNGLSDSPGLLKQSDLWLGLAYRETNSPDQQLICFRRALDLDPSWATARLALADSLVSASQFEEAINEYTQLVSHPETQVAAKMGHAKALLLLNLRKPASLERVKQLDEILKRLGEFDDILKQFDESPNQVEQRDSLETQIAILRMETRLAMGDRNNAVELIAEARGKHSNRMELWTAQIGLAQSTRDWKRVRELLQDAEKQFGDTPAVRFVKGRALVQRYAAESSDRSQSAKADGQEQSAEVSDQLRQLSEPDKTWSEQQRIQLARDFAPLFLSIGDFHETERLASLVGRSDSKDLQSRLLLLDVSLKDKRSDLLNRILEEIRNITGERAIWNYAHAIRLRLMDPEMKNPKNADDALSHLAKARAERPTWDRIPLLAAEIYAGQGNAHAATEQYLEAIRLGVRTPIVTSRALALLFKEQRFDDADKLMQRLRESQNLFTEEMARAEIGLSLQLGHEKEALKAIGKLGQEQDPVWLGQVYAALKKPREAKEQFRQAIAQNSKDPKPWVGLVQILVRSKEIEEAKRAVEEAKSAMAPDQAMLALGQCYVFLGNLDLAKQCYQAALDQSPENVIAIRTWVDFLLMKGAASEAETFLKKMLRASTGEDKQSRENRLWFQRRLAAALLAEGKREQLTEALAIVQQNLDDSRQKNPSNTQRQSLDQDSYEDLRMKANILSRFPLLEMRQEAIQILESLHGQKNESILQSEDRFLLSRLYLMVGDRVKGRSELRNIIAARKDEPRYLAPYVQLCLQMDELTEAELYLEALQKTAPDELVTRYLQTQLLFNQGKYQEVVDRLKKIGTDVAAPPKGIGNPSLQEKAKQETSEERTLWVARRFDEYTQLLSQKGKIDGAATFAAEAERFYSEYIQSHPKEILVLVEFLARTTQIDRALDLLQEHGAKSTASQVMGVALALRKNTAVMDSQLSRLQDLLKENVKTHNDSMVLTLVSADLMNWRGDYHGASKRYQEVIRRDERNVAALNNLAVMLAMTEGDPSEAMRYIQKAIEIGGPMDALIDTRGLVHLAAGRPEKASLDFKQAISENESAERRFHEAVALAQLKQFKLAQDALDQADKLKLSEKELHTIERSTLKKLRSQLASEGSRK